MPKKKSLTVTRVFTLLLAYLTLCISGGVVTSLFFLPAVFGANNAAKAVVPSLQVEGIDFDVTSLPQKSTMYASDGTTKIAEFYQDNRVVVPIKEVSTYMQQAVVAREDRRFFEHSGVDVQGVLRAFLQTYVAKGAKQGGSSLTQQYVKNVLIVQAEAEDDPIARYHASEDTIARKLREMLIAVQMEKQYSKLEILQGYLNVAQFGSNRLYGVETAARRYFNVSAKDLNIVQSATIAAITKNPENYDPSIEANQPEAERQRNIVLDLMLQEGYISQAEHDEASNTPIQDTLDIQPMNTGCNYAGDYAFFCSYVTNRILNSEEFGKTEDDRRQLLKEGGLNIVTTLDVDANSLLMETARNTIPADDSSGFEIMMASVKPGTGEVLGFGINRTYNESYDGTDQTQTAVNYMVDSQDGGIGGFPVGSSIKPFNLIAWMQAGRSINENLQTTMSYRTSEFNCDNYSGSSQQYLGGTESWSVSNALTNNTVNPESPFLGVVRSHNTTQASMGAIIGLCRVADAYTAVGYHDAFNGKTIDQTSSYNPSMMIGSVNVSPLTMANMYATLAADGVECTPIAMTKVTRENGDEIDVPKANCHQAIDSEIVQTVAYTMNQGVVRADGAGGSAQLANGRKTFAKTGTNEAMYLATGGFIPNEIATFVLIGDAQEPNNNPVANVTINGVYNGYWDGGTIAAPAWKAFMDAYADRKQIANDDSFGQPSSKYTTTTNTVTSIQGITSSIQRQSNRSNGSNSNNSTNSNDSSGTTQRNDD